MKFVQKLGESICSKLLFIHSILGCDTTSKIYGIGKPVALSKVQSSVELARIAELFLEPNVKKEDIIESGENAIVILYGGDTNESLNTFRFRQYSKKVLKRSKYVEARDLHQVLHQRNSVIFTFTIKYRAGGEWLQHLIP